MDKVGLLFVGAALFINGLMLLGKVDQKSAIVFNLFIGSIKVMTPFDLIFTSTGDSWMIFNASGIFLFGLTYLYVYVGISNLKNFNSSVVLG
ncbi:AmiS/UreI family transporter [Aeribacillus composti]|uniref:AmiS/UreI family transporter n=1 Tax=Aeribacillus composti TaxID=1868734 RepID=UPI003D2122AB